tara:strand:- start:7 stop:2211 length:2205 start_codon:yes stop_codon:yes gene_type:complete
LTKYSIFNERRNYTASPFTVIRNKLKIIDGDVNIAGSRSVDNAKFIVKSPVDVKLGDIVSFITDDIDTDELIGAWNFYFNLKDESGYNLDASDQANDTVYVRETQTASRFLGHPYLDFNTPNPRIVIEPTTLENNSTLINFDNDSSIVIWCKVPSLSSNESQIIFDRSNTNRGIKIGVKESGGSNYVFLKVKGASGAWTETTLNANTLVQNQSDIMICAESYSFGSSQYKVSVNGGSGNYAVYSGDIEDGNLPRIRLGLSDTLSERYDGRIYSMRMYSKIISDTDKATLFKRKQPYSTMKFAGKVTSVDKGNTATKISAAGFSSELLLRTELTASLASNLTDNGVYKYSSSSGTNTLLENIISDIITAVNTNVLDTNDQKYEFVFDNTGDEDDDASVVWKDKTKTYHMRNVNTLDVSGKLVTLAQILSILGGKEYDSSGNLIHNNGADSFFMLPRKVLIFESSDIESHSNYTVGHNNIYDGGFDINSVFNDVSIFGKGEIEYFNIYQSISAPVTNQLDLGSLLGNTKQFMGIIQADGYHNPIYYRQLRYSSTLSGDDVFNYDSLNEILHYKVTSTYIDYLNITIAYLDLSNNSDALTSLPTSNERTYYYQQQNDASIKEHGKKSKKMFFPILEDMTTTAAVCRRVLGANATSTRTMTVVVPNLTNSIHIGTKVRVTSTLSKVYNKELTVRSIQYKFPDFKTIVTVGDYKYDFLDNIGSLANTVSAQESERTGVT